MRKLAGNWIGVVLLWGSLSGSALGDFKDGLVGYWNFDETSGLVAHSLVPASADGQLFNFPSDNSQWVPGQIGGALYFRGQFFQDYVIVPSYPIATSAVSFSGWVNADDTSAPGQSIFKNWGEAVGQFQLGLNGTSMQLAISVGQANGKSNGGDASNPPIQEGAVVDYINHLFPTYQWVHVGFVVDPTLEGRIAFVKLYVNGQQVGIGPYDGTLINPPPMKSIGMGVNTDDSGTMPDGTNPGYWWGSFDDFGLWTRVLSDDEMAQIYALGLNGKSFYGP